MVEAKGIGTLDNPVDVIVVGGGVAGLAAADWLKREGRTFVVLEGQGRVGGRVETKPSRPDLDLGAAYFGPLQSYTMRYCDRFQIERINNDLPLGLDHRIQSSRGGEIFKFQNTSFSVPDEAARPARPCSKLHLLEGFACMGGHERGPTPMEDLFGNLEKLEAMSLRIATDLNAPWNDRMARELDRQSVRDWMLDNIKTPWVDDLLTVGVRAALSAEPEDISMLYLMFYTATGGSFANVMAVGGGADTYRFARGANDLPDALAEHIGAAHIVTRARVTRLEQGGGRVTAVTSAGSFTGRRCIIAMSPTLTTKIEIPDLPVGRRALCRSMRMGRTIKAFVDFKSAWWRERGSSGYALSAKGPIVWTMDNSWPDRDNPERFSLMAFIVGKDADALSRMPAEVRKAKVLKHLAELFEVDEAFLRGELVDPSAYHEGGWGARAWSGGCPGAFFPPRTFVQYGPELRRPFGRVHWAGSETATDWVGGYMNGALQSGIRAAEEVLKELV